MVIPLPESPPDLKLHPQWRPPWLIPQKVVLKPKDLYKEKFTGRPAKARCVCALNLNHNEYFRWTKFRYTGVEHFAEQVEVGDFISIVDISSFYLRLPFARKMLRYFAFEDAYRRRVADLYPPTSDGTTFFPFTRFFLVAKRPSLLDVYQEYSAYHDHQLTKGWKS